MHDFKKFPELTNNQMSIYYFQSPHKQITESFGAKIVKVTDGDTVRVKAPFREFDFPIRIADIAAPELSEGGHDSKYWLQSKIENEEVYIVVDKNNRVGRYGRLIGKIMFAGMDVGNQSINAGKSVPFDQRKDALMPDINLLIGRAFK